MYKMHKLVQMSMNKTSAICLIVSLVSLVLCGYWLTAPHDSKLLIFQLSDRYDGKNQLEDTDKPTSRRNIAMNFVNKTVAKGTVTVNDVRSEEEKKDDGPKLLPNIIFAMADDLGWGDVQYNNGNAITPNLNKMASSTAAILLQRYYSGGPVCSPTRGTVLTGRNHNRYCVWHANVARNMSDFKTAEKMPLPLSEISVARVLRKAGYATALFGKWHLGDFKPLKNGNKRWPVSHPGQHGFQQWQATARSARSCTTNCGCFVNTSCLLSRDKTRPECTNYYTVNGHSIKIEAWPSPIVPEDSHFIWSLAEKFIREQVRLKKPFFLYLPFHAVHKPYIASEVYRDMYLQKGYNLNQADYYGTISAMDDVIGQLRILLEELSIKDKTLLWFSSDNGPARSTPGVTNGLRGKKSDLYEGGIRVPGIIEWPDVIKTNKVSWLPIVSNDLLPTVYDILNVKPADNRPLDGISILPFLKGEMQLRNHSIFWAYRIPGNFNGSYSIAVSGDQYKLIAQYDNGEVTNYELYNLVSDISESNDIKTLHPALCQQLLHEIKEWRKSVIDSAKKVGCLK